MQDTDLFTKHSPDNKQRLDQHGHIGKALGKLPDTRLEVHRPHHAHLKAEVAPRWRAGRSRWRWPSTEAACDRSGAAVIGVIPVYLYDTLYNTYHVPTPEEIARKEEIDREAEARRKCRPSALVGQNELIA